MQKKKKKPPFLNAIEHHFSSQPANSLAVTLPILIKPG
jgi:hypothetical protein